MQTYASAIGNIKESLDSMKNNSVITVQIVQPKSEKKELLENPFFTAFVFPILIPILVFFVTILLTRKKERAELNKIKTEAEKNQEEINKIKSSYHPIILSSLQIIQNQLLQDKISSLKELLKLKTTIFNIDLSYYNGESNVDDAHDYYSNVYTSLNRSIFESLNSNYLNYASLFPSKIKDEFQGLVTLLYDVRDIQDKEFSKLNQDMPNGVENKLRTLNSKFETVINLIRNDLHLDNTFIHEFFKEYQK